MGRGALTFKGESSLGKKNTAVTKRSGSKKRSEPTIATTITSNHLTSANETGRGIFPSENGDDFVQNQSLSSTAPPLQQPQQMHQIVIGRGKITASGTVVTGYGTKFTDDVQVGDAIIVQNDMRIVTIRLSDISLNISSPFAFKVAIPSTYSFMRKPRTMQQDLEEMNREQLKKGQQAAADIERHKNGFAFANVSATNSVGGGIIDNNSIIYRERTEHGNYRIKRIKIESATNANGQAASTTRSDMLEIRSKKTSDKYC